MNEYHKINTVFKRRLDGDRSLIHGDWSEPEFEFLQHNDWEWTEKVDGTNIRIMWDGSAVKFGGRTERAQLHVDLYEVLVRMFTPEKMSSEFHSSSVCLYGEGYGAGIQGCGGLYRPDKSFVLFDVRVGEWWLRREDTESIAYNLGIECVPVVGYGSIHKLIDKVRGGLTSVWGNFEAEGVVARPIVELRRRNGSRIITKVKSKDFKEMEIV